jgi:hypothetical protein
MQIIKIQFVLFAIGLIALYVMGKSYFWYIAGFSCIILPTLLTYGLISMTMLRKPKRIYRYLFLANVLKYILVGFMLFACIEYLQGYKKIDGLIMIFGFIVASQSYILAGLFIKER